MLGAAQRLGVSQARLSRRLQALEDAVGTRLFDRSTRGCTLTEDGRTMFEAAERVEAEMLGCVARLQRREDDVAGTIRIGAPDGFGSAFLAPRLKHFAEAYPALRLQLVPVPRSFSLSQREADVAIMVGRPQKGRLRVRKLVDYTLGLYASEEYLDLAGRPEKLADLERHRLIGYVEDLIYTPELNYAPDIMPGWRSSIEVSTAIGQLEAVRAGAGIGILNDFMADGVRCLTRLFPERTDTPAYWTGWHENMRVERRVLAVVELLDRIVREERALFCRNG
jgi:DNA-binding transcriptional LysR family regulator